TEEESAAETYTGSAEGMNDDIEVEVTIEDDEITALEVISHDDTEDIAEPAFEELSEAVVNEQSTSVDTVSGATISSEAYLKAIERALEGTGINIADGAEEETEEEEAEEEEAEEETAGDEDTSEEETDSDSGATEEESAAETYTGSAEGMNDDIEVEVTIEDDEITALEVISHDDTEDIAEPAFEELSEAVVNEQSTSVDTVSGATISSEAYLKAVDRALEEANYEE
ncbi:MAG: FMN-binding protein, partial [Bacillota bacterium]